MMRIGHGFDIHQCAEIKDKPLLLAGVHVPHDKALLAHSDGDVVLHALCDAFLGAMALGDIGEYFPDHDPKWRGCDSFTFIKKCCELMQERELAIANIDLTVLAQQPKLSPYKLAMRECLSNYLQVPMDVVNIKATTMEGLGAIGEARGIACHAVVLLMRRSSS